MTRTEEIRSDARGNRFVLDRIRALVASQIHRLGNRTNLGASMYVWARRFHAS